MWISSRELDNLKESHSHLARRVQTLEYKEKDMAKEIASLIADTKPIEYGESHLVYLGMGLQLPGRKTKSLTNVIHYILDYLKLEITETKATDAVAKLVKIKPIKPIK